MNVNRIQDTFDDIDNYLGKTRGLGGNILSYITREHVYGTAAAGGQLLTTLPDGSAWPSIDVQIIYRAPHVGHDYSADNSSVWDIVRAVFHGTPQWPWVQTFQRTVDGRGAYFAAKKHFLGTGSTSKMLTEARSTLRNSFFNGNRRGFNFESYCSALLSAWETVRLYDEKAVTSEQEKMTTFTDGVKAPYLQVAIGQVLANPEWTMEYSMNFVARFIERQSSTLDKRNVSGMNGGGDEQGGGRGKFRRGGAGGRGGGGRGPGGRGGRGGGRGGDKNWKPEDKWYSNAEFYKLSENQQTLVRELHAKKRTDRKAAAATTGHKVVTFELAQPEAAPIAPAANATIAAVTAAPAIPVNPTAGGYIMRVRQPGGK